MKKLFLLTIFVIASILAERLEIHGASPEAMEQAKSAHISVDEIKEAHNLEITEFIRDEADGQIYKTAVSSEKDELLFITVEYLVDTKSKNITAIQVLNQNYIDG